MTTGTSYAEVTLAKVVLSIVITFMVCQIPRIFLAFYRVRKHVSRQFKIFVNSIQSSISERTNLCWGLGMLPSHPSWMFTLTAIQHFFLIVNSSANFIIYCFMGTK